MYMYVCSSYPHTNLFICLDQCGFGRLCWNPSDAISLDKPTLFQESIFKIFLWKQPQCSNLLHIHVCLSTDTYFTVDLSWFSSQASTLFLLTLAMYGPICHAPSSYASSWLCSGYYWIVFVSFCILTWQMVVSVYQKYFIDIGIALYYAEPRISLIQYTNTLPPQLMTYLDKA